jgi:hypothetical protein
MDRRGLIENQEVDEQFVKFVDDKATRTVQRLRVHEASGLFAWATTRSTILDTLRRRREEEEEAAKGLTVEGIRQLIEGRERLICIFIADPSTIKELVIHLSRDFLNRRKRKF